MIHRVEERVEEGLDRLSKPLVTLDPAVEHARRISREAHDVPDPIAGRQPRHVDVELVAKELTGQLADGVTMDFWTFDHTIPGPMVRVRVGDTVRLTLKNAPDSRQAHNFDLHAINGPGGGADATAGSPPIVKPAGAVI